MLLLHISDIHFQHPACSTPATDADLPYRTRLIQDAAERTAKLGAVNAILVSGDIAFRGLPQEYEAAFAWLRELAKACSCSVERVFVVPGNHDIDRRVIIDNLNTHNAQLAIAHAGQGQRERVLRAQLGDGGAGRALLAPLAAYNDFAARFSCQVFMPEQPFWCQDLRLDEATTLRLHGLTSTLLSGIGAPEGEEDARGHLYLSPLQTVLDPAYGRINLVLCHHPPDWFEDQGEVEDAVCGRAAIHLFGHKHRQRITRDTKYVQCSAGAVNPDRNELAWKPGYNLIQLSTVEERGTLYLDVEAHVLDWQTNPELFRARMSSQTSEVYQHRLPIRSAPAPVSRPAAQAGTSVTLVQLAPAEAEPQPAMAVEATMGNDRLRNFVLRFWRLASSQRRDITIGLGLINEADMTLLEPERYGRALLRAAKRGLLERVAEEMEQVEERQ